MWFTHGVSFAVANKSDETRANENQGVENQADTEPAATADSSIVRGCVMVRVRGQFALDRLRKNFLNELRAAAMHACGSSTHVAVELAQPEPAQADLPLLGEDASASRATPSSENDSSHPAAGNLVAGDADTGKRDTGTGETQQPSAGGARRRGELTRGRSKRGQAASGSSSRGRTMSMSQLVAHGAGTARERRRPPVVDSAAMLDMPSEFTSATAQPKSKSSATGKRSSRNAAGQSAANNAAGSNAGAGSADGKKSAAPQRPMNASTFVSGSCNQLAFTAMTMVCQQPGLASPLFLCGPSGTGKTHMLSAIADQFRRRHRMRRVMHLSAEQFTNDFITSVGNSGITSFRRRYREVDALLIDDVQFLGSKKATLREVLYTVETLANAGRPLIFSGSHAPTEIQGLTQELAGRMASGLVCPVGALDLTTRQTILRRWLGDTCQFPLDDDMVEQLTSMLAGDGRVISGVVNTINLLQRMYGRNPTMDEVRRFGGDVLRSAKPVASLSVIETAVCDAFQLPLDVLRSRTQTRAVTEPRMLAMYLSRQMTSAAYTEIARHFGGKSHSTAIAAEKNVKGWIEKGKSIGRGQTAMSAQEAIERIESLMRA
ncbi:DnaA/Hda family protein [Rubripirellula lacrimiformis]|nr:DnaA/Hda family protein [Rubripirellula lacrimiformis]